MKETGLPQVEGVPNLNRHDDAKNIQKPNKGRGERDHFGVNLSLER